jgi:hypothetical protein
MRTERRAALSAPIITQRNRSKLSSGPASTPPGDHSIAAESFPGCELPIINEYFAQMGYDRTG